MQTSIVVGCGYLGSRVAKHWLAAGREVVGVVNNFDHARRLKLDGVPAVVADVTRPETLNEAYATKLAKLPPLDTIFYCVGHNPQSGITPPDLYVEGLRNFLDVLPTGTRRFIYASSTSVYGQHHGAWVDEDAPCRPTSNSGKIRLEAERVVLSHHIAEGSIILRLAGIYGKERLARRAQRLADKVTSANDEYLNLIHVDDAAKVVVECSALDTIGLPRTFLVSDGHPLTRQEFLFLLGQWHDSHFEYTPEVPVSISNANLPQRLSSGNKRIDNYRMLHELGNFLSYPSVKSFFSRSSRPK